MSYFKKWISYLDYYEYGYKKKNSGHLKVWIRGGDITLDVQMKGMPAHVSGFCEVQGLNAVELKKALGRFPVHQGTGYYNACLRTDNLDGAGLSAFSLDGIRLWLDDNHYCLAEWEWEEEERAEGLRMGQAGRAKQESPQTHKPDAEGLQSGQENKPDAERLQSGQENKSEPVTQNGQEMVPVRTQETMTERMAEIQAESRPESEAEQFFTQEALSEDKWQQLCRQYPVCHPFEDGGAYLSIAPKDFIILRREYQNLVNNSFLLHGFYNYRHIILGKTRMRGEEVYYLGVPGTYYEREKMVAVMFGFEGFEGVKNSALDGSAQTGDFGYYMKQVEI